MLISIWLLRAYRLFTVLRIASWLNYALIWSNLGFSQVKSKFLVTFIVIITSESRIKWF